MFHGWDYANCESARTKNDKGQLMTIITIFASTPANDLSKACTMCFQNGEKEVEVSVMLLGFSLFED